MEDELVPRYGSSERYLLMCCAGLSKYDVDLESQKDEPDVRMNISCSVVVIDLC